MKTVDFTSGTFESFDGTPIYYEVRGDGEPIVFIYGIACLMNHWHHQIRAFSNKYKVITFDIRAHHKSGQPPPEGLTVAAAGKDLVYLLKHLNIPKAHFVGHSFGVPLLLAAYNENADMFISATFVNGFAKNPIKGMFGLDVIEPLFQFIKTHYKANPDVWKNIWKAAVNNPAAMWIAGLAGGFNLKVTQFKDIEIYARGVSQISLDSFIPLFEDMINFDGEYIAEKMSCPCLIVAGDRDFVTPLRFQEQLHTTIPGSEFFVVPYGSHCTQLDFPDYFNLRQEKFLEKVSSKKHSIS
jgi:pimeloyl-ACP methyl ester carboxylesterase